MVFVIIQAPTILGFRVSGLGFRAEALGPRIRP